MIKWIAGILLSITGTMLPSDTEGQTLAYAGKESASVVYGPSGTVAYFYTPDRIDTTDAYYSNWDTRQIFAYLGEVRQVVKPDQIASSLAGMAFVLPRYGKVWRGFGRGHQGLDIDLKTGDEVFAAFEGKVRYAMYNRGGFGNLVIIRHPNGLETWYAHLSKLKVKPDDRVKAGDVIGLGGSTGRSRSAHLHLEFRYRDVAVDPLKFIDIETKSLLPAILDLGGNPGTNSSTNNTARRVISDSTSVVDTEAPKIVEETVIFHTIKYGDNLYNLARKYGTTVNEICRLNNMKASSLLRIGAKLKMN